MKKYLLYFLLFFVSTNLSAQEFDFSWGTSFNTITKLNNHQLYDNLGMEFNELGIGAQFDYTFIFKNKFTMGLMYAFNGSSAENDSVTTSLFFNQVPLYFGRTFEIDEDFRIIAAAGLAYNYFQITAQKRDKVNIDAATLNSLPRVQKLIMSTNNFSVVGILNFDYNDGLNFGIQYYFPFYASPLRSPDYTLSGFKKEKVATFTFAIRYRL
jgi:hypothetical protein